MAKHTHLALLCAVVIIGLLISPAMAVEAASGEEIYRPFVNAQERPDIDGDMIVWEDDRNGNKDIYFGTVDEFRNKSPSPYIYVGERITSDDASQEKPSISGDYIVWQDNRDGNWDIYLYQRSTTTTTQLTTDTGDQWLPIVRGNHVAWYDDSSGRANIVLYDIAAGAVMATIDSDAKTTIPDGNTEFKPALSEKYVAWIEDADERAWYYDIADETKMPVSATGLRHSWPSLYGSQIAWECYLDRSGIQDPEIYLMDLDNPSGGEQQITNAPGYQVSPALSGNIIAWEDMRDGPRGIYMHDLATGGEGMSVFVPEDPNDEQLYPTAGGTTVAWQRGTGLNSNLYIFVYGTGSVEPAVTTITVTPNTTTLAIDETETFTATVLDQDGETMTGIDLEWASSNETVGTIDSDGTFTALAEGTANVTATADEIAGTATVTVTAGEPDEPVLESIRITPATAVLAINDTRLFAAAALDQDGAVMTGVNVTWTSSDETVGTIDANGTFTALAEGTANVTATAENVTATAAIIVNDEEPALASIAVAPSAITLGSGDTATFTATAFDQFGTTMTGVEIAWTSSDEAVGTIGAGGVFSAVADGTTTVTATAGNITGTAAVTVTTASSGVAVSPSAITLDRGDSQQFTATVYDPEGNVTPGAEVTWESSDEAVGTIDADGLFTAVAEGTATITATAENETGTATVTVDLPPAPTRIEVEPATATILPGDTQAFTATVFDQRDNEMDWIQVSWSSSDPEVGTIDSAGLFGAFAEGSTDVTASAGDVAGTAAITVSATAVPEPTPGNGGGGGGGGGGDSSPSFSAGIRENLRSGETFTFSELTTTSVSSVNVTAAGTIPKMMLTVKKAKAPSAAEPPAGDVYEYIEITPYWVGQNQIGNATVFFTVPADWLESHNATAEDVVLVRYVNGTWESLETEVLGEESGKYNFRATTPGFSTFAIVASPVSVTASAVEINATTEVTETPGVTETSEVTGNVTTEPTTVPATTPATPLVYAPLLAPLAFFLWARKNH